MELTTREAAGLLDVSQSRVRAMIAAGRLQARRLGTQWLIDAESVDQQGALTAAKATGRAMAPRVAWAVGDLVDGGDAAWLSSAERSRLRKRVRTVTKVEVLQKWLSSRSTRPVRYRLGSTDTEMLLAADGVVRTGVSAGLAYGLRIGGVAEADAYVTTQVAKQLIHEYFLIESRTGNLTLRLVDHDLHLRSARLIHEQLVATRVLVGVDLSADSDARTREVGRDVLGALLTELRAT